MGGGAWPFLVGKLYPVNSCETFLLTCSLGGVICLLNCDNERDLDLLNSPVDLGWLPAS